MACEPKERTRIIITHDGEPYRDINGKEVELGDTLRFLDNGKTADVVIWNGDVCLDFKDKNVSFSFYVWMHREYEVIG